MKFILVALFLIGLAKSQEQSSQCIFKPEERLFTCRNVNESNVAECEAVAEFGDRRFSVFGIGMIQDVAESSGVESTRYWLYPRSFNATSIADRKVKLYGNHSVILQDGRVADLMLWYGERATTEGQQLGIRVTDVKCYERLVRLFANSSRQPHMIRLEAGPQAVQEVPVFGEVLVMDKNFQKRWLWGYGWGLDGWGWDAWDYPYDDDYWWRK
jgi:hypothetical protein